MKQRPSFPARLVPLADQFAGQPGPPGTAAGPRGVALAERGSAVPRGMAHGVEHMPGNSVGHQVGNPVGNRVGNPGGNFGSHSGSQRHGMDSSAVRMNLVKKLAALGVRDPQVLQAMGSVERHRFIDSALVNQAYEDTSLPIGLGQTISKPGVVARMAELLRNGAPGKLGRVLEIGTGCGYQAAVLSFLAAEVYSMERLRGLHDKSRDNLRHLRLANVHLLFGDGMAGYAKGAPYAAIIAAAGGEAVPQAWVDQLAVGGRLVAPVVPAGGVKGQQALMVIDKTAAGVVQTILEAVHFVPLKSGVA